MLLVVDNGSIYTKQLTDLLSEKDVSFEKCVPQLLDLGSLSGFDSFILSGRLKNERKINEVNSKVVVHCVKNNHKLLGICYGAEILALALGGTIKKMTSPHKGNESVQVLKDNSLCGDVLDVFESHSFEISRLPNVLIPLAKSRDCEYEIIQYDKKPIYGTQFHPEMSQDGNDLIEKFCSL